MKKLLLSLSAAVALTASATTVTLTPQSLETIVDKQTFSVVTGNANFTIIVDKVNNSTAPTYNANGKDLRVYANGTLSVQAAENLLITDIVFNISSAGLKRLAPITASDGSIAPQTKGDNTVTWSGENNSIVFTVGAKADYGSDGSDKAGQFDITDMVVTYVEAGSTAVLAPSISYDNTTDVVTITTHTEGASIYYTIDGTTPTTESTLYDAPFMLEKSCTVKAIAVKDDVVSAVSTSSITVPARAFTIAEMLSKAPEKGDVVLVSCDLTVVYKYSRYIYVVDNAGGYTLLYGENTYNKGDVIPAGWYVTYSPYSTLPEFAPQSAFPAATSTAEVTYDTIESFSESDINKVAYLKNVTFEAETGAGGTPFSGILADGTEVAFRNNFYVGTVEAGTYNVLMAVAVYNNNLQLYPIEFTEVEEDVEPFEVYVIGSNVNGSSWSEGQADAKFTYLGNGIYEWNG
ncbi:MAG: chitobiase/beta-hexosaminidase C-terminal domain-containing protein, partial [Muribaculaceae bacterium]|nr:chitobiase/beta-hexosaminidase C-terminal domain-containing protein [Muribaculaceae bacterium]